MSILSKIQDDILDARLAKDKDKLEILSTLKGEIQRGVNPKTKQQLEKDEEVIPAMRSYVKSMSDTVGNILDKERREKAVAEINIVKSYLPNELSYDELLKLISENSFDSIKDCMQFVTKYQKDNEILIDRSDAKEIFESLK